MSNDGTLKVSTPSDREIVMTRAFDAPRHLVFEAFSKPELLTAGAMSVATTTAGSLARAVFAGNSGRMNASSSPKTWTATRANRS